MAGKTFVMLSLSETLLLHDCLVGVKGSKPTGFVFKHFF